MNNEKAIAALKVVNDYVRDTDPHEDRLVWGAVETLEQFLTAAPETPVADKVRQIADEIIFDCDGQIDIDKNDGPNLAMRCNAHAEAIRAILEQRCERGTPWDAAVLACAKAVGDIAAPSQMADLAARVEGLKRYVSDVDNGHNAGYNAALDAVLALIGKAGE